MKTVSTTRVVMLLAIAVIVTAFALPAHADLIGPGGSVVGPGDPFTAPTDWTTSVTNGTKLAEIGPTAWSNASVSGMYRTAVFQGGTEALCPTCLTFVFYVSSAGPDSISSITTFNYAGFTTNVGFNPLMSTGPGVPLAADHVFRSSGSGSIIGFRYGSPGAGTLLPGETSFVLEIATNAQRYQAGNISVQDGVSKNLDGFAPAVPDGGITLILLSGALMGLETLRRKYRA